MVKLDPFDKSEQPLTEAEKSNIQWRASDMSNDSQDEKVQMAKNYVLLRDPEVYQKQQRAIQAEKAEEEKRQRRKEAAAERERERQRKAALDKAARGTKKQPKKPAKPTKPAAPAKGKPAKPAAPAKGKPAKEPAKGAKKAKPKKKKPTEPLPKPTRRIPHTRRRALALKLFNKALGTGRRPAKPAAPNKKAKKVGTTCT